MLSPFAVLLASAVVASASSSSAAASASASASAASSSASASNPYIPSGISSTCSTYLATLNTDTSLSGCTSALINATSAYAPSSSSSTQSKSSITSTLDTLCGNSISDVCPQSLLTGKLADFQTACSGELVSSPNTQVKTIYDTFYGMLPLLAAVCTKDDSGNYCATESNSTSLSGVAVAEGETSAATSIRRAVTTAYLPNAAAIDASNVMFLGLSGNASSADLCTTCTRNVLTAYLTFESNTNYVPGLAQSVLIFGQSALYSGVLNTCGSDFLTSTVQAAGGISNSNTPAGALSGALSVRAGASVGAVLLGAVSSVAFVLLL